MLKTSSLCFVAVVCWSAVTAPAVAQTQGPQVQFVQTSAGVTFKDGVLTLKNAAPMTVFFSDRPERLTGQVGNDQFAKLWTEGKNSFKSDPPNALLAVFNPQAHPTEAVVVLSNPRLDGKDIAYDVRPIKGSIPARAPKAPCSSIAAPLPATRIWMIPPTRAIRAGRRMPSRGATKAPGNNGCRVATSGGSRTQPRRRGTDSSRVGPFPSACCSYWA